jgi:methyltransferase family protein
VELMNRHDFLSAIHASYEPRSYLEIGVNDGRGLQRSHTRTIGVDPAFKIVVEVDCDLMLVKATSDDFFARENPIARFPEGVIDLSFIDGLHIFEYALRDFLNAERLSGPNSVIILDDMLPRTVAEAARDRHTVEWTGDVFKVAQVLERYRPDLVLIPLDTTPTGLLLVLGADPANTVLKDNYDAILAEYVAQDPQVVPEEILHRTQAADPVKVTLSPIWAELAAARTGGAAAETIGSLRELRGSASYISNPPEPRPWPPVKASAPAAKPAAAKPAAQPTTLVRRIRRAVKNRL